MKIFLVAETRLGQFGFIEKVNFVAPTLREALMAAKTVAKKKGRQGGGTKTRIQFRTLTEMHKENQGVRDWEGHTAPHNVPEWVREAVEAEDGLRFVTVATKFFGDHLDIEVV
jgi:hypothetical protein